MAINIILLGAVIVLIAAGAALVLLHVGQQPASASSTTPTTPITPTTVQSYQSGPYITQSQAQTLMGAGVTQFVKVYNTSAEIATLQYRANITKVWLVIYNSPVNQSIMEFVIQFPSVQAAQTFYLNATDPFPSNVTIRGIQNGMDYAFMKNGLVSGETMEGWKGNYVTWTDALKISINASTLSSATASNLP